ncbi:hypothetical protein BJ508DRAFT_309314 [Ascobolus immersus RN42]|uniref:F-box domain-containing protein n=1 Tax=Ascobolus immersus RN42 TaxID=1160509 RepID=A0A3N4HZ44_ASCIM|nr:hypothetical protein BJ508DRAFT_309314 [Ascobolus immersus RN42]
MVSNEPPFGSKCVVTGRQAVLWTFTALILAVSSATGPYATNIPGVFRLPVELRLMIYREFTGAFALLQLANSHPRFRNEIRASPKIFTRTYGYQARAILDTARFQMANVGRLEARNEMRALEELVRIWNEPRAGRTRILMGHGRTARLCWRMWRRNEFENVKEIRAFLSVASSQVAAQLTGVLEGFVWEFAAQRLSERETSPRSGLNEKLQSITQHHSILSTRNIWKGVPLELVDLMAISAMKSTNPTPTILTIPTEIRLMIYREVDSALALLLLSHAHPRLYYEIHSSPSIYSSSNGYGPAEFYPELQPHGFNLYQIRQLSDQKEYYLFASSMNHYRGDRGFAYMRRFVCPGCWSVFRYAQDPGLTGASAAMREEIVILCKGIRICRACLRKSQDPRDQLFISGVGELILRERLRPRRA